MKRKGKSNVFIIIIIIAIIVILTIIILRSKKSNISFDLIGAETITVEYGTSFVDPGIIAMDGDGEDISKEVIKEGIVNTNQVGVYSITYSLNYNGNDLTLNRTIIVKDIKVTDLDIVLNGDNEIYLLKGNLYNEEGAYVVNKSDNTEFTKASVDIYGDVNTNIVGTYDINYILYYNGESSSVTRKVNVFDISTHLTPETMTPNKVKIEMSIDVAENNVIIKLPDGSTSSNKRTEYEVEKNGNYDFIINLNNKEITKTVNVNNIIDHYTCTGEITINGTKIEVSPLSDRIKEYQWIINNETITGNNIFTSNKIVNNAQVKIVFTNNETYQVSCNITDKLVYHFKYDENNTKPYMECNTYTKEDKVRLDAMLKKVVDEAGYGTRAGVVAAARFLVGGLDYKVRYLGPKSVNPVLGSYSKEGLNIGQSNAWGCRVSGWIQGMDCTNFVSWAFAQNGIKSFPYSNTYSKVREVIDKIKVGDLLYKPCNTAATCAGNYKLSHVGIIIGVDDKYFYVAEATEGKYEAIVVTKWEKNNMPSSGEFSIVHFFDYASDGNVTNMWMSE